MAIDNFSNPKNAGVVVPSDVLNLTNPSKIYVGNGGAIKVTSALGSGTVTLVNIGSGTMLPLVVVKVWSGSTTATNMIAMW